MELSQLLNNIRTQYDDLIASSQAGPSDGRTLTEEEQILQAQVRQQKESLQAARAELSEARRQWHSLQVEFESLHALERGLENSLRDTQQKHRTQLWDLTRVIQDLEAELGQVRSSIESQRQLHHQLLNTKVRLEHEIATYRQLLEREEGRNRGCNDKSLERKSKPPAKDLLEHRTVNHSVGAEPKTVTGLHTKETKVKRNPGILRRQKSLIIITEQDKNSERKMATVKTQEIVRGNVVQESAEAHGTVETKKIDVVIKQWEGSFFKGNPKLRKKSVSLRFDLHMAAADEASNQSQKDNLSNVEVRLVMKRSRSISAITQ